MFPIPSLYKYLGILVIFAGVFGAGYYKGYSGQHNELVAFKAETAQAAADQKAASLAKDKQNEENTQIVVQGWKHDHDQLIAAISGMRQHSGSGTMPQAADGQQGHDDSVAVEGGTCSKAFYRKALEAELMLETWQAWALLHGIAIE